MDLESVRTFVKVAELASFTLASEHLGSSKARVSTRVRALEVELGSTLLHRSTRAVRLTPDGERFLVRARQLVADGDELASMFLTPSDLKGRVRIDLPQGLARSLLIPNLPDLLVAHPELEVQLSTTDRRVDLIREGFDCVLRVGKLADSHLVARRLGEMPMVNCASPSYLERHGTPHTLADLDRHLVIHYALQWGAEAPSFEYRDGTSYRERPMRAVVTVNSTDAYNAACIAGLGIIQAPRWGVSAQIARGELIEILKRFPCAPLPVALVHAHGRRVPPHVRAAMNWMTQVLTPHLD
jgi:DNA-binding transcriptional LysR family regulator